MKLRRLCEKDVELILEWMKDESIAKYFRFTPEQITRESIMTFIKTANASMQDRHYAIVDKEDMYLGTISLKNIDEKNKNAEYAIALRKCAIGYGVAKWATEEIIKVAFNLLGIHKVYLNVLSYNTRAIKFYEKMGFCYEGGHQCLMRRCLSLSKTETIEDI